MRLTTAVLVILLLSLLGTGAYFRADRNAEIAALKAERNQLKCQVIQMSFGVDEDAARTSCATITAQIRCPRLAQQAAAAKAKATIAERKPSSR